MFRAALLLTWLGASSFEAAASEADCIKPPPGRIAGACEAMGVVRFTPRETHAGDEWERCIVSLSPSSYYAAINLTERVYPFWSEELTAYLDLARRLLPASDLNRVMRQQSVWAKTRAGNEKQAMKSAEGEGSIGAYEKSLARVNVVKGRALSVACELEEASDAAKKGAP